MRVSTNKITQLNLSFKAYYPENYFFDITVLHQFNNLHLYGLLSTAIEYDKDSFIILKELYDQNYKIIKSFIIDMVLYEMDSSKEEYRKYINKQGDKMKEFSFN